MEPSSPQRWFNLEQVGGVTVVRFTFARMWDEEQLQALARELFNLVDQAGRHHLVLDFGAVGGVVSSLLAHLIRLQKKVQAVPNGRLALCRLSPEVHASFDTLKLTRHFHIYEGEPEALQSFPQSG